MRILGIDPGLDTTVYGIIEVQNSYSIGHKSKIEPWRVRESRMELLRGGVIKTRANRPIFERLDKIYKGVMEIVEKFRPDILILEKLYSHYRHPTTAILMGHARGVICLVCAKMKIPLVSYSATRIKKAITGNGNASKHQVKMMVVTILRLNNLPECCDISDALGLAIAHFYISKLKSNDCANLWTVKREARR